MKRLLGLLLVMGMVECGDGRVWGWLAPENTDSKLAVGSRRFVALWGDLYWRGNRSNILRRNTAP